MNPKIFLTLFLLLLSALVYSQQKGYYRTPAINGNTVIFTAEGDLWKYDAGFGFTTPTLAACDHTLIFSLNGHSLQLCKNRNTTDKEHIPQTLAPQ